MNIRQLTDEQLYDIFHESFEYREGELYWKERPLAHFSSEHRMKIINAQHAGKKLSNICEGYIYATFFNKKIKGHRIVFMLHHGFLPKMIDHIDGNKTNNRIENLRACSYSQNQYNKTASKNNTSGVKGVSFHKATGKFQAAIKLSGKQRHLGLFDTIESATIARIAAANQHHGEFVNHG